MTFLPLGFILFSYFLSFFSRASAFVIRRPSFDTKPLRRFRVLFRPTPLLQHPLPDIRRAVQNRHPLRLTGIEKTNTFEIDKIQFLQIQNDWRLAALDFGFELIQLPESKFAAEPNSPLHPFNPQRHFLLAPEDGDGNASLRPFARAGGS